MAAGSDFQALLVASARLKGSKYLVIFPETLPDRGLTIRNVEQLPERRRN